MVLGVFGALGKHVKRRGRSAGSPTSTSGSSAARRCSSRSSFLYFGLSVAKIYTWPDIDHRRPRRSPARVQAGIFALGLNEGAYMTEIVRAGILSIDPGQMEAAESLGMTYGKAMRRIVLPQAARVIIPPLGNEFNNMLKTTSLLSS